MFLQSVLENSFVLVADRSKASRNQVTLHTVYMYVHAFLPNTSCNCAIVQLKSITTLLKQDTVTDCFMVSVSGPYMSSSRMHCNKCDTRNKQNTVTTNTG